MERLVLGRLRKRRLWRSAVRGIVYKEARWSISLGIRGTDTSDAEDVTPSEDAPSEICLVRIGTG